MVRPLGRGKRRGLFAQGAGARLVGSGLRERAIRLASVGQVALSAVEVAESLRDEGLASSGALGTCVGDVERSRLDGRAGRKRRRLRPVEIDRERERGGRLLLRNVRLRLRSRRARTASFSGSGCSRIDAIGAVKGESVGDSAGAAMADELSTRTSATGGGGEAAAAGGTAASGSARRTASTAFECRRAVVRELHEIRLRPGGGGGGGGASTRSSRGIICDPANPAREMGRGARSLGKVGKNRLNARAGALGHRRRHLLLELLDDVVHVAVPGLEAAVELQLLDRLDLVSLGQIDLGELADGDQVLAIEPERVRERANRVLEAVQLLIGPSEGDVRRHRGGVQLEPALESDDGVAVLPVAAVLLRERQELARRGVLLKEPLELLESGHRGGRTAEKSHVR